MERRLSKSQIESWCGNVLPLRLLGAAKYGNDPITWTCDSPCVQITSFADDPDGGFTDGILLTLLAEGQATITASFGDAQYTCQVNVHEMRKAVSGKELNYYTGDFHDHSCNSHKKEEVCSRTTEYPRDLIRTWKRDGILDFAVISDHADLLNAREYYRGYVDAEESEPMDMIIFPGCEAEITPLEPDRYGIVHKNAGEIVTVNAANFANTDSWEEFYQKYETSPFAISCLAHPQVVGYSAPGIWNFCLDKNNTPRLKQMVKLVEMGNGADRSANLINEYVYSTALDNGFRVSVTCSSDSHGPNYELENFPGRTVIMAPEKTKEAFADAILNNRVYATSTGNVKLFYSVNGISAPADLPLCSQYQFHVETACFRDDENTMPVKCHVISDYGKCVKIIEGDLASFDFTVESDTARYFYLRLLDKEGRKTWSCPVFTGRSCDSPVTGTLTPLDKADFTATDTASGADASGLINDDPTSPWFSEGTTCSICIDMQQEQQIAGLSHYPRILDKIKANLSIEDIPFELAHFPYAYRVSTSCDGNSFHIRASGVFRIFGCEEIIRFDQHSARYIKLEILSTCGAVSERKQFRNANVAIGELTVYR